MKDSDSGTDAQRVLLLAWSGGGAVVGALLGTAVGGMSGEAGAFAALCGGVLGGAGVYLGVGMLANGSGAFAASLFMPSGRSTPERPSFSLAESLAARGRYGEAAAEYARAIEAHPLDAEPCIRLARLQRDRLREHEEAARWFAEAIARSRDPNTEHLVVRELTELLTGPLRAPALALPHLARHAERHAGGPRGDWARRTLADLKNAAFPGERKDAGPCTSDVHGPRRCNEPVERQLDRFMKS